MTHVLPARVDLRQCTDGFVTNEPFQATRA